jgi:WD40 repeat protein
LPGLELVVEQIFRALSEVDKEGRATRRSLPFSRLLAETGVARKDLLRVLDRFRADDCSFIVPSVSAVPQLRNDTRIDVGHEALLRRWDRISAEAGHGLGEGAGTGWLEAEEADGRFYRALLALLEAGPSVTLPLDQVESRWEWWKARPRTAAWAERYGGGLDKVEGLFKNSIAALETQRKREEETERREREAERKKIESEEAAKRERLEHQAEVERVRADSAHRLVARTRVAAIAMAAIAAVAVVLGIMSIRFGFEAKAAQAKTEKTLHDLVAMTNVANEKRAEAIKQGKIAEKQRAVAVAAAREAERQRRSAVSAARDAQQQREAALASAREADRQRANAESQQKIAEAQTTVVIQQRAKSFEHLGRDAVSSGDNDSAAAYFAAAYADNSRDPVLKYELRRALDKLSIRGPSLHAHGAVITTVRFNPNPKSQQIATASADGSAKLWDTSGHLIHAFDDQAGVITSLAFDPSGRHLATAGADGSVKIRDLQGVTVKTAPPPLELDGHTRRVNALAYSHDGTKLATASGDGYVKLWESSSGKFLRQLHVEGAGPYQVNDVAFTPDNGLVVVAASDGALRVWNAATGELAWDSAAKQASPSAVATLLHLAVAPDGKSVVAGAVDGAIVAFDLSAKKQLWIRHDDRGAINAVSFDPTGRYLLAGSDDGSARILNAKSGEPNSVFSKSSDTEIPVAVLGASFNPANGGVATTYADGSVSFWTIDGEPIADLRGRGGNAGAADFSPDGAFFVSGGRSGDLFLWRAPSTLIRANASHGGAIDAIAVDAGGRILTGSRDGTAALWRLGSALTRERIMRHSSSDDWVVAANFSADGKRIVTAGGTSVKIWDAGAPSGLAIASLPAAKGSLPQRFSDAAFLGDRSDEVIASQTDVDTRDFSDASGHWLLLPLEVKRGAAPPMLKGPSDQPEIRKLASTSDGRYVLALSGRGTAAITSVTTQKTTEWRDPPIADAALARGRAVYALGGVDGTVELGTLGGERVKLGRQQGRISALSFSADDRWLASAGKGDYSALIWNVGERRLSVSLKGHKGEITSIVFAPSNAPFILTTSVDGTAKLWDRATGDLLASVSVPGSSIRRAAFMPGGDVVVLGTEGGGVFAWPIRRDVADSRTTASDVLAALRRSGVEAGNANVLLNQALQRLKSAGAGAL